jgi:hypothetical protein
MSSPPSVLDVDMSEHDSVATCLRIDVVRVEVAGGGVVSDTFDGLGWGAFTGVQASALPLSVCVVGVFEGWAWLGVALLSRWCVRESAPALSFASF